MRRVVGAFAAVMLVVGASAFGLANSAGSIPPTNDPILQVKKVVTGTSTAGFTARVACLPNPEADQVAAGDGLGTVDLPFLADGTADVANGPGGWTASGSVWQLQSSGLIGDSCTVTEPVNGGATSTSFTCAYSAPTQGLDAAPQGGPANLGCPGESGGPSPAPVTVSWSGGICSTSIPNSDPCGSVATVTVTNNFPSITAITVDANNVLVTGSGFSPNTNVDVDIHSDTVRLGSLTADANGAFSKTYAIPCSVGAGSHTVTATAANGQTASTGIQIAVCAAPRFTG